MVWALLLLAALGTCGVVALARAAALHDGGGGTLSSVGGRRRARHSLTSGAVVSQIALLPPLAQTTLEGSAPADEIAAPEPAKTAGPAAGWAPPIHRLAPPPKARPALSSDARRRAVAAGGAIAAVLAVAAKPERARVRRHR